MVSWYREGNRGTIIKVKVIPRSSKPGVQGVEGEYLKVRLKSPPVEGKANRELVEVLAKVLGVSKGQVEIISGVKGRVKEVMLSGVRPEELEDLA
ncbi:MAG: YggU family protein [Aquificota bacterium]|nr:MAG: YggU family protein [Aquificota bacterium]